MGINIKLVKNGPAIISELEEDLIRIEDETHLVTYDEDKKPKAVCRCGKSKNKPFCDGSHRQDS